MLALLQVLIGLGGKVIDLNMQAKANEHVDSWIQADKGIEDLERQWPDIDDVKMGALWKQKRRAEEAMKMLANQIKAAA